MKKYKKYKKALNAFLKQKRMTGTYTKTVYNRLKYAWLNDCSDLKPAFLNKVKANPKRHYYLVEEENPGDYYFYSFRIVRANTME